MCKNSTTQTIERNIISDKKVKSVIKVDENCYNVESNFVGKIPLVDLLYKIATSKFNGIN